MAKILQINMPDGTQWQVPAQKIAEVGNETRAQFSRLLTAMSDA